jgi:hypothetical protein
MTGQRFIGKGVDCWNFVIAIMDERRDKVWENPPRHSPNMLADDCVYIWEAYHKFIQQYKMVEVTSPPQPWDVIFYEASDGMKGVPTHIGIVGDDPRVLWHAVRRNGVIKTTLAVMRRFEVVRVRCTECIF